MWRVLMDYFVAGLSDRDGNGIEIVDYYSSK